MEPVDALLRYPLFALLGRQALEAWVKGGPALDLRPGETLLEAGTPGKYTFVVLAGRMRLSRPTESGQERSLGVLGPGDVFGEYALLPPHQNTATCRACEPGRALRLPLILLRAAVRALRLGDGQLKSWLRLHALVGQLRQGSGLGFVSAPSLVPLMERCHEVSFKAAHTLQADGLLDDSWIFISDGEVALHDANDPSAAPRVLRRGDCFGERALLGWGRLPMAVALSDTSCWQLTREQFLAPPGAGVPPDAQTFQHVRRPGGWIWVGQRGTADCGVAALAMALRGHGAEVTLEEVAAVTELGSGGASISALARAAALLRERASAVRVGVEQLSRARLPAVAHLRSGHYVTLFEMGPTEVVVGDPASGVKRLPLADFRQAWSGHLLLLGTATR